MTPQLIAELAAMREDEDAMLAAMVPAWQVTIRSFSPEQRIIAKDVFTSVLTHWFIAMGVSVDLREWMTRELEELPWDERARLDA